jgi:hypothetical protein
LLFLVAIAARILADLLLLRLVMAVKTGLMRNGLERRRAKLAMTFVATHFIIRNVDIVAEFKAVFFLIAT